MRYNSLQYLVLLSCFSLLTVICQGQDQHEHQHDHDHEHSHVNGHDHINEISIATGVVWVPAEDEVGAGLHLHYIRGLGDRRIVGLGGGLEAILESHKHVTLSAILHVRIVKGLFAGYAPGILFLVEDDATEIQFAQHLELGYEFEIGRVHLGPVFEFGIEKEALHYMLGAHVGLDF